MTLVERSLMAKMSIGLPLASTVFGFTPLASKDLTVETSSNFAALAKSVI